VRFYRSCFLCRLRHCGEGTGLGRSTTKRSARQVHRLTHDITPNSRCGRASARDVQASVDPTTGTRTRTEGRLRGHRYEIATDQFGTQLDPPAHWAPGTRASTSCRRPTRCVRGGDLDRQQVEADPKYALQVSGHPGVRDSEREDPEGSVVMVRSDWSKKWTDDPAAAKALAADPSSRASASTR
jgi:hypothetical protein